jgi:predicted GH43/DUF377 family glycosyl hydrolase
MDKKLKLDYVIFPMGFTFDKDFIYLSYGRNDITGGVLKLDREKLLRSLLPVEHMDIVSRMQRQARWKRARIW